MENVALITGADRGLGLALTQALLESGWRVIAGRHLEWPELDKLAEKHPHKLKIVALDVRSYASVKNAAGIAAATVDHIDLVISNAALNQSHHVKTIRDSPNFEQMGDETNVNAIGGLRLVEAFLPLVEKSSMKRLCFVSSEAGSIGASSRTGWFGYCMSKAALHMAVKNLYNDLHPQGISFRLYHPGYMKTYMSGTKNEFAHMEPEEAARFALDYFLSPDEPTGLVMRDWEGKEWLW